MTKKMVTIKLDIPFDETLKEIAKKESRSQGKQVEHWIKKDAKRLGIEIKTNSQT
jgi:hypothetical protein